MIIMKSRTRTSKSKSNPKRGINHPLPIGGESSVLEQPLELEESDSGVSGAVSGAGGVSQPIFQNGNIFPPVADDAPRPKSDASHLAQYKFPKGVSGNPSGRPKDIVKAIGQQIAAKKMGGALKPKQRELAEQMGFNTSDITLLEHLMLNLATSANPAKTALFLERTFGKVANININAEVDAQLVARFRNKFTDSELQAIADGESPMDILFDKLPNIDESPDSDDIVDGRFSP